MAGCGYRAAYGEARPAERLAVVGGRALAPRPDALHAAVAGARTELSRAGVLGQTGFPRLVIDLVRVDETSSGIAAVLPDEPSARGSSVGVVVRGWIEEAPGGTPVRDSGDVKRVARFASAAQARVDSVRYDEALRSAAREAGRMVARRVMGEGEPDVEPM